MKAYLLTLSVILVLVQCFNAAPYGYGYKSAKSYGGYGGYGSDNYRSDNYQNKYDNDDEYNSYGVKSYSK
jgi:hypothetical protein